MSDPIPVNLAVEDSLSEAILSRLLTHCGGPWAIGTVYSRGGVGYLRKMITGFNNAAKGVPFLVLADLDGGQCVPAVLPEWLPQGAHANMILRFAVREVEAWVLADTFSVGRLFGIKQSLIPTPVEQLDDPKRELVNLARRSRKREIVADVVPNAGSTAVVGRNYNPRLIRHVQTEWNPEAARLNSESLNRAIEALSAFRPSWATPAT
jgi:hypothetical protein